MPPMRPISPSPSASCTSSVPMPGHRWSLINVSVDGGLQSIERGDECVLGDEAGGDELAPGFANGGRERCRPPVLVQQDGCTGAGLKNGAAIGDVVGAEKS